MFIDSIKIFDCRLSRIYFIDMTLHFVKLKLKIFLVPLLFDFVNINLFPVI